MGGWALYGFALVTTGRVTEGMRELDRGDATGLVVPTEYLETVIVR